MGGQKKEVDFKTPSFLIYIKWIKIKKITNTNTKY